jgi:hypothetical protein
MSLLAILGLNETIVTDVQQNYIVAKLLKNVLRKSNVNASTLIKLMAKILGKLFVSFFQNSFSPNREKTRSQAAISSSIGNVRNNAIENRVLSTFNATNE